MGRLRETEGLTDIQEEILKTIRQFVDEQIIPVATELEHKDEYPTEIVEGLKELGLFGLMIPEEYGGLGESLLTYARSPPPPARRSAATRPGRRTPRGSSARTGRAP